ncbi:hypothetical protein N658DRAFT_98610 [Parathielavia hyrcaniae]|uniref:Uncharacterized protein n=1 Tax=Parathielavia hyrcaniae TaxID=113614 RepID=A0AAN6PZ05_9PEZI|nr:hypothetical protein N658DRAFT_98610 [Parathielavia hyrcaniae]
MEWSLSTWLALGRASQLLGSALTVGMHGYLTIKVFAAKLGLSKEMIALEMMACVLLGYSILVLSVGHTSRRSRRTPWLTAFVVLDLIMCGVLLGAITTLARAGLPLHCAGMTRKDYKEDEQQNTPKPGYTTIRFSDESAGEQGELDRLCELDRSYYGLANALVFTYIFTITMTVLRILEKNYTAKSKVNELLESLGRAEDIRLKVTDSPSLRDESPDTSLPQPPPSEGIITRTTSLRSNFTAATFAAASQTGAYGTSSIPRRPVGLNQLPPPLPPRSLPPSSPTPSHPANQIGLGFSTVPLEEEDNDAEAALVSDGMRHESHPSHHHRHHHQQQQPHHQSFPQYPHHHYNHHHQQQRHPSRDQYPASGPPILPMLSEEQQSADSALVSDGMRPAEPALPPYHPGNRRMSGHAGEDNEMRLSGYVKGQTRAQDMKDSGGY